MKTEGAQAMADGYIPCLCGEWVTGLHHECRWLAGEGQVRRHLRSIQEGGA